MNTQGFEIVAEMSVPLLNQVMQATWTSGGSGTSVVPHSFEITPGTAVGPYVIGSGHVEIPLAGLAVGMAPDINGLDLKLGLQIQLQVQNPPVPSATMFTLTADAHARLPLGHFPAPPQVGLITDGLPQGNVTAVLTSGDPFAANAGDYFSEFIDQQYATGAIPSTFTQLHQNVAGFFMDLYGDIYDDPLNAAHKIDATLSADHSQATISLPVHVKMVNIAYNPSSGVQPVAPMGIETRIDIVGAFSEPPGAFTLDLTNPTVTVGAFAPAAGAEGTNWTNFITNASPTIVGLMQLELSTGMQLMAKSFAQAIGVRTVSHPTVADIQDAIATQMWQQLTSRHGFSVWTPQPIDSVNINDTTPQALADVLAIAINAGGGANAGALTNALPGGTNFGVGITASKVLALIDATIHRPESQGGFGPTFPHPPHRIHNVDGHNADLTRLDISLTNAIHLDGDVTVIDAILGSIDVDASFTDDVGLHWEDGPSSTQHLVADPGPVDVHESALAWLLTFLFGFLTFGLLGAIIAVIILAVILAVANSIGSAAVVDGVTGQLTGIGAWPGTLTDVGSVTAHFQNVDISPDGFFFSG
jgi:hypothetical protein